MKCQHCGIHFDDEERVCPMCGARAGSKGRMTRPAPKWHGKPRETYTEYHPTIENSSSAKTAKSKARPIKDKPKKNSAKGVVIAIIVIALLQLVPTLIAFVVDDLVPEIESSFGNSPAPDYDSDYSYEAQDLSSILGTDSGMVIDNSDTFRLHSRMVNGRFCIPRRTAARSRARPTRGVCTTTPTSITIRRRIRPISTICTRLRSRCTIPRR